MICKNVKTGAKVRIISDCKSRGKIGTFYGYTTNDKTHAIVQLDGTHTRLLYNINSLEFVNNGTEKQAIKEELSDCYNIAVIKHISRRTFKLVDVAYHFANYNKNLIVGDAVLCDTAQGVEFGIVIRLEPSNKVCINNHTISKEIICKVEKSQLEDYFIRLKRRKEKTIADDVSKEMLLVFKKAAANIGARTALEAINKAFIDFNKGI